MRLTKIAFADKILPIGAEAIIQGISRSLKLKVIGEEMVKDLDGRVLYAFFHGRQFLLVFYMRKRNISLLSSLSRDGEIQARILKKFGYEIVRGSSAKGGVEGIIGLKRKVLQDYDIGLAVDGPQGPCYSVKDGIIFLAKKLSLYIVPLTSASFPAHIFKNAWDKYQIPYPFGKGVIIFGEPYKPKGEIEEEKENLKEILISLTKEAEEKAQGVHSS
ncbi:MAG: lysophospholipid acyltransferase family protein [bacterium]